MIRLRSLDVRTGLKSILLVFFLIAPALVVGSFIRTGINGYVKAQFEEMIEGTAYRPFAARPLVPLLVRTITSFIPESMAKDLDKWGIEQFPRLSATEPAIRLSHLLVASIIWYLSIVGFAFTLWRMILTFYDSSEVTTLAIVGVSIAGIPAFFKYYSYLYDLPQLFLFTLCLLYLARRDWFKFVLFFAISTLNKETSILLTVVFSIHYYRLQTRASFLWLLGAQLALYAIIRFSILSMTGENPGSVVEFHLVRNLTLVPYSSAQFLAFLTLLLLIAYDWANKPKFIKNVLLIVIPMVSITFFLGYLDEYRDYYELYAAMIILAAHTILKHVLTVPFNIRQTLESASP